MEIIYKGLDEIIPYENNPRKNAGAEESVANSIREFGFKVPIVIDKDNVIVCGHTRYKAAQLLEMDRVPCILADDLSEEQIRSFRLADNKVSELATWDMGKLEIEMDSIIDIEMSDFGFEMDTKVGDDGEEEEIDEGYRGDERERTFNFWLMSDYHPEAATPHWNMPILAAENFIPDQLLGFKYMLSDNGESAKTSGIHFFIDDYQFERIWKDPRKYIEKLRKYQCVLTPDFSLYMDMALPVKIANVYRSRLIGQIMQEEGLIVIPTLQYAGPDTFEFAFDGIEPGGVVGTSTVGVMTDEEALKIWSDGMDEAIRQLHPSTVVCYGPQIDYDWGETQTKFIPLTPRRWGKAHEEWSEKRVEKGLDNGESWSK